MERKIYINNVDHGREYTIGGLPPLEAVEYAAYKFHSLYREHAISARCNGIAYDITFNNKTLEWKVSKK